MIPTNQRLDVCGERFGVDYLLSVRHDDAPALAKSICYEQTVEFPSDLVPEGDIPAKVVGQVRNIIPVDENHQKVSISYAVEVTGFQFVQFLNTVFGNCSLFPGVRVVGFDLPQCLLDIFKGPRFGREGVRKLLHIGNRPLLCTALKPQGLSSRELADQARQFALGGIDIIKDDHGLCDQPFSPFFERVRRCSEAVGEANDRTGFSSIYMPSISGPAELISEWAHEAKSTGAGGLLISPGLVGWDVLRNIAGDDDIALPIMSHPTFLGSFVTSPENGIEHGVLFGTLMRLAGADLSVYPNYGGRFSFSREECGSIAEASQAELGTLKSMFPAPGGGMTMDRIPEIINFYNGKVALLVGGGLHRGEGTLTDRCLKLRRSLERPSY